MELDGLSQTGADCRQSINGGSVKRVITINHVLILKALRDATGLSVDEIANQTGCRKSTVTRILGELTGGIETDDHLYRLSTKPTPEAQAELNRIDARSRTTRRR